jgi:hypothetical protein
MKNYALVRVAKLHDWGRGKSPLFKRARKLNGVQGNWEHDLRLIRTDNANPEMTKQNVAFFQETNWEPRTFEELDRFKSDYKDPEFIVKKAKKLLEFNKITPRDDQVKVMQCLLFVSGEVLRDPKTGEIDKAKTHKWMKSSVAFLKEKYQDRLLACVVHMDETNPHMTAYLVPLVKKMVKKTGRKKKNSQEGFKSDANGELKVVLSAKNLFAPDPYVKKIVEGKKMKIPIGEGTITKLHTEYFQFLKKAGLDVRRALRRGAEQIGLEHQTVKQYYKKIGQPVLDMYDVDPWDMKDKYVEMKQKANLMEDIAKKADYYQKNASDTLQEVSKVKSKLDKLTRDVPITEVIEKLLGIKGRETEKEGFLNFYMPSGQILEVDTTTNKFKNLTPEIAGLGNMSQKLGGRGSVDAIVYLEGWDPKDAIVWIADSFSIEEATSVVVQQIKEEEESTDRTLRFINNEKFQKEIKEEAPHTWDKVFNYLTKTLKFKPELINNLSGENQIYSNAFGNLVFRKSVYDGSELSETGLIIANVQQGPEGFREETGGDGLVRMTINAQPEGGKQKVILTSDPMDALALKTEEMSAAVFVISKKEEAANVINSSQRKGFETYFAEAFTAHSKNISRWLKQDFPLVKIIKLPEKVQNWIHYLARPKGKSLFTLTSNRYELKPENAITPKMAEELNKKLREHPIPSISGKSKKKKYPGNPGGIG